MFSVPFLPLIKHIFFVPFLNISAFFVTCFLHIEAALITRFRTPLLPGIYVFAMNTLFWLYPYQEMKYVGIRGTTDLISDEEYSFSRLWYSTPLSNFAFLRYGFILTFVFISIIPILFLYFPGQLYFASLLGVLFYFGAPISFSMAFVVGRYHAPAWFFSILGLLLIINDQYVLSSVSIVLVALTSSTVLFVITPLVVWWSIFALSPLSMWSLFPALLVSIGFAIWIINPFSNNMVFGYLTNIFADIGTLPSKYQRRSYQYFSTRSFLFVFYSLSFIVIFWLSNDFMSIFSIPAFLLFLLNDKFLRFADTQTTEFVLFLSGLIDSIFFSQSYLVFIPLGFWLLLPFMYKTGTLSRLDPLRPVRPLTLESVTTPAIAFFSKLKPNTRILLCFKSPQGRYENLFCGFRHSVELAVYSGIQNKLCVFPNFYMIFTHNKFNDDEPWVESISSISATAHRLNAEYAIIYKELFDDHLDKSTLQHIADFSVNPEQIDPWSARTLPPATWSLVRVL